MEFNSRKNNDYEEQGFYSMPDIFPAQSASLKKKEILTFNDKKKINENVDKNETNQQKDEKNSFPEKRNSFMVKLEFNDKIPPRDEFVGLSSRIIGNKEEDFGLIAKRHLTTKIEDMNISKLNYDKNLELFKKEEAEFREKMKKLNFLDDGSEQEHERKKEKTVREKEIERSLNLIILEEKNGGRKDTEKANSKIYDSKMSIDMKVQDNSLGKDNLCLLGVGINIF